MARGRYSRAFVDRFLVPFGASIWSADPATFLDFPATTYARFVPNHGMVDIPAPAAWRTVTGGSRCYVEALTAPFARPHPRAVSRSTRWSRGDAGA